jgi:hypothetical protein
VEKQYVNNLMNIGQYMKLHDNSTIKSTDSRISRISHDFDPRRLSAVYPNATGGVQPSTSQRPFSWHSESFDLDAHFAATHNHTADDNAIPMVSWRPF